RDGNRVDRCLRDIASAARRVTAHLDAAVRDLIDRNLREVTPWRCELALPPDAMHDEIWRAAVAAALARLCTAAPPPWGFVCRAAALRTAASGVRAQGPRQPLVERTRGALLLIDATRAGTPPSHAVALAMDALPTRFGTTEWSID